MQKTTNILVVGTGGQGVMTASEILAEAALSLGFDVKKTEVAGMAQRGGVVSSHVRFGQKVLSPQIEPGTADILLGFEAAEGLRWQHMLKPAATALINSGRLIPPVVTLGLFTYPDNPLAEMRAAGFCVAEIEASALANSLGNIRLGNSVMLGAISAYLPFPAEVLERCLLARFAHKSAEIINLNRQAFHLGKTAAQQVG